MRSVMCGENVFYHYPEGNLMLTVSQSEACAAWIMDQVRHVIETFGPRAPGSRAEREAQEYIREEMQGF